MGLRGAIDSCNAAFDQTIRTTFGNAAFDQTIRATFGNTAFDQTIRATFSNAAFDQTIRATFSNTAFDQTIRATFSNTAFDQTIRATFSNTAFDDQNRSRRATFSNAAFDQTIRTPFSHTTFNQPIRAAFSDQGVSGSSGKSVNCENRESDAEKGLAFHDRVLRGVVGWYGADLTPRIFYENFIDVMVTIDASDVCPSHVLRGRCPNAQLPGCAGQRQFMQRVMGQSAARLGEPDRAARIMAIRRKVGILLQQAGLQFIQARANLFAQIRAQRVRRGTGRLPLGQQTVLHQFVGLHLRGNQLCYLFRIELALGGQRAGIGDDLRFPWAVLNRFAAVPLGQSDEIADIQAFV